MPNATPALPDIFVSGDWGFHTIRIPSLVSTPAGLVCFAEGHRDHDGDAGVICIVARFSADAGATWTDPAQIAGRPGFTWDNPTTVVLPDGTIMLLTTANPADLHESEMLAATLPPERERRVFIQTVDVPSLTATPPRDITNAVKHPTWGFYATGPGHGTLLTRGEHAGRIVFSANHSVPGSPDPSSYGSHLLLSDDLGDTWRIGHVERGGPGCWGPNETCATELGSEVAVTVRNQGEGESPRAILHSADGGETATLTPLPQIVMPVVQGSILALDLPDRPDSVVFSGPNHAERRARMSLWFSLDGGRTWGDPHPVDEGPSAYSDLCLQGGNLHLVWEAGERSPTERLAHVVWSAEQVRAAVEHLSLTER